MATEKAPVGSAGPGWLLKLVYRIFAYFGLFSIFGALVYGFRYDAEAPPVNFGFNALLYGIFIVPHLIMTRSWFKRVLWGNPAGTPLERRVYITITVAVWLAVFALHRPMPGVALEPPQWVVFAGTVFFLFGVLMFFEGVTLEAVDGLLGVPGSVSAYSHGPETPLFTEGPYARVRHPQYSAFILAAIASLLIHPHMGQLFWVILFSATFVGFIPVEEAQLIRARRDDYRRYMAQTRWRLFRGIW